MARENVIIQDGQWFSWKELDRQDISQNHRFSLFEVGCVSDSTLDDESYSNGNGIYIAESGVNIDGLFNMADAIRAANESAGGNCHMVIKLH
jgi:hypothetical protein